MLGEWRLSVWPAQRLAQDFKMGGDGDKEAATWAKGTLLTS